MSPSSLLGDCFDNVLRESFFGMFECELLNRLRFPTQTERESCSSSSSTSEAGVESLKFARRRCWRSAGLNVPSTE